jgi:hypothetical protein
MKRGLEHVSKVMKEGSYIRLNGEIFFIQGSIILLSKDDRFFLKVIDTRVFELLVEKHYTNKYSSNRTIAACIKLDPKDEITDSILGTGEHLREAIPMLGIDNR